MGGKPEDFYASGPPLARGILIGGNPYLLPGLQAFRTAFVPLAGGYLLSEHDNRMGHIDPAQQMVASLNENPSPRDCLACRRVNYLALKNSFGRKRRRGSEQGQQEQA